MDMFKSPALQAQARPALWGAAAGAVALAIVGFSWGGWTTGGKAATTARTQADEAVVAALAPLCVDRFQRAGDASAQLTELKKLDSWAQGNFVEKGGWATMPGMHTPDRQSAVARTCAQQLVAV